jgi:hypothetical protein
VHLLKRAFTYVYYEQSKLSKLNLVAHAAAAGNDMKALIHIAKADLDSIKATDANGWVSLVCRGREFVINIIYQTCHLLLLSRRHCMKQCAVVTCKLQHTFSQMDATSIKEPTMAQVAHLYGGPKKCTEIVIQL